MSSPNVDQLMNIIEQKYMKDFTFKDLGIMPFINKDLSPKRVPLTARKKDNKAPIYRIRFFDSHRIEKKIFAGESLRVLKKRIMSMRESVVQTL